MMLTVAKGPTCYEDIKKVGGIVRDSFRDACFEMGFLNDDKEYFAAINEAKDWGSEHFLRKLFLTEAELKNLTLIEIENKLQSNRRSLHEFKDMPYPDAYVTRHVGNRLIYEEHDYNTETERENFNNLFRALTDEQRSIFEKIMESVGKQREGVFFYMVMEGPLFEATDVIIWDEAPMAHKNCFEALDRTLKDVMTKKGLGNKIFGDKVVVFGGDFRQILPVVPRAGRSDIVHASICSSYIWDYCQVLTLTKNMRLQQGSDNTSSKELAEFSKWILNVGDGKISEPNDGLVNIEIPQDLLIKNYEDPIKAIVENTYPNLVNVFQDVAYLQGKSILASTIEVVDKINHYVLDLIPGEEKEYLSYDSIDRTYTSYTEAYEVLTPEFLSKLRTSDGLCNGTRLIVTRLANNVIEAKIISGKNIGNLFYIPRMSMSPSESPWPFKLIRRQFPIIVSYTMTINKSQGQSLDSVGLYLPSPVFSHEQLYVAISRVTTKSGLKILIHDKENVPCSTTTNVVYKEVFQSLC
ncbi:uncharacterized protein LOC131653222 [Vicia villosa]|uniref:uncharacterized protein LOC131653222 n=1 Tax=Vicia villosa TaxID=3911 RepID=UPI00273CDE22|nr:uncharacterized protein LOC131653222 [Vicia villosa]